MIQIIPILSLLKQPLLWRFTGFTSSIIGLLCYALSSSFKHLFGEWNTLKISLYTLVSLITCSIVLLAANNKWKHSKSLMLKAHVGFLVLMLTSIYSSFYDKAVNGKSDVLGLISCVAFALMSFSLSRQIDLGFEIDLLNFFLGCLTVQLMNVNLMLGSVGGVFCYLVIVLRNSLDSQMVIGNGGVNASSDHVAIEIDAMEIRDDHDANCEDNHHPELPSLRKRHFAIPNKVYLYPKNSVAACVELSDAAKRIRVAATKIKQEAEACKIVAAMKIQHAFHNYKVRKMNEAATRIQRNYRTWKIRRESFHQRQQGIKILGKNYSSSLPLPIM